MTSMTVFRVRGIPEELTLGALEKALAEADKNGNLKIKATIAPSCYDKTQTALVQFDPLPSYLQDAGSAEWGGYDMEVETEEGELFDIAIDKDFFGLTQLYPTKSGDITADIVAVTSLAGHAFESWRGKGGLGRMWLRDFLSVDLPNCRTLTYGYDSRLGTAGVHQLRDYNRGFLEELKKARTSEEERERPIIFIGHSFGGIIVAQSLVRSKECNPRDDPAVYAIHQATRGVIFYGTPHRGLLVDDILSTLNLQDYSERVKLVNSINKGSDLLHSELERFVDLAMQLRIVSFYERFQTRRPVQGANGLARTGEYVTTVDTDSALLHLGAAIEKKIPVDADNTEIVKFKNKQSQAYSSTLVYLQEFEKKITTPPSPGTGRGTPWPGMNHGSLEVSKSRSRRSSSTRSDRRGPCVEPVQETQVQIWTGNRGSLMISKGKPMSFYQLVAEPYEPGCGSPSLSLQRVECKAPPSENPPPEYTPLDQLQNGRERLALRLDSAKSETITALDPELYTPDKKHPYRGIWIAAHSTTDPRATNGHLYEFLLFHQPNEKNLLVTKISGDVNMPRGERSMFTALPDPYSYSSPLVVGVQLQVGDYLIGRSYWIPATLRLLSTSTALLEGYNCTYRRVAIETYMR